tara:strand:+ start:425 stop:745 length:321 start_codon:yes stop_codon:yes gene_type:complete
MRLDEFVTKEMPFDVVDDCAIYMRNNPSFYRKSLFPAIIDMKKKHDSGKPCDPEECMGKCCDIAIESYCKEYKLGSSKNVFGQKDRDSLVEKMCSEELTQIKDGAY